MHLKRSSAKCRPFCLGLNVLLRASYGVYIMSILKALTILYGTCLYLWWCHDIEINTALLALCEGNPPIRWVNSSHKEPVMQGFYILLVVSLNTCSNKQSSCQQFETPQCSCDVTVMYERYCFWVQDHIGSSKLAKQPCRTRPALELVLLVLYEAKLITITKNLPCNITTLVQNNVQNIKYENNIDLRWLIFILAKDQLHYHQTNLRRIKALICRNLVRPACGAGRAAPMLVGSSGPLEIWSHSSSGLHWSRIWLNSNQPL